MVGLAPPHTAFGSYPDLFRRGPAERDISGGRAQIECLIVIPTSHTKFRSRTDRPCFQEFEQLPVAFVDAADHVVLAELGFRQQNQAAMTAAGRALQFAQVPVRTRAASP